MRPQAAVNCPAVKPVKKTFLVRQKGKASANSLAAGNDSLDEHVRAQMHMLMTIEVARIAAIDSFKFVELGIKHVLKVPAKKGIVQQECVFAALEKSSQAILKS